jgi:hypothetical protein
MSRSRNSQKDGVVTEACNWLTQSAGRIFQKKVPRGGASEAVGIHGNRGTVFKTKASCEDIGLAIAAACLETLENTVPKWIEEAEEALAEVNDDSADNSQEHEKFHLELSALAYILFRIAIHLMGPDDKARRSRIFEAFNWRTAHELSPEFLDLAERRGPCYFKCVQENLGGEFLGSRLITRFNYFVCGGESFGDEPLRGGDFFESQARGMTALAALNAVFDVCLPMFQQTKLK